MAIQRGEIYFVNLNPVQGREQAGSQPVLVLSIDAINRLPLVVTVCGTRFERYPTLLGVWSRYPATVWALGVFEFEAATSIAGVEEPIAGWNVEWPSQRKRSRELFELREK